MTLKSAVLVLIFLSGCSSLPSSHSKLVAPEGTTETQMAHDQQECTRHYFWRGQSLVNIQFYMSCLGQKGYKEVLVQD